MSNSTHESNIALTVNGERVSIKGKPWLLITVSAIVLLAAIGLVYAFGPAARGASSAAKSTATADSDKADDVAAMTAAKKAASEAIPGGSNFQVKSVSAKELQGFLQSDPAFQFPGFVEKTLSMVKARDGSKDSRFYLFTATDKDGNPSRGFLILDRSKDGWTQAK